MLWWEVGAVEQKGKVNGRAGGVLERRNTCSVTVTICARLGRAVGVLGLVRHLCCVLLVAGLGLVLELPSPTAAMGRMDVSALRYLSRDELRVLQAVEQGMKNHDLVPVELISSIANLKHGGAFKALSTLLRCKLLRHDRKKYDGYSLNYLGYDYLSFATLAKRNVLKAMGRQIGVGKESDVFIALDETEERTLVVKMHRLGRTSFRKVKEKRDYHQHRKHASWLYLSHLAAEREFAFMKILKEAGFPVPDPIDCNRHCVVMGLVDAYPLTQIKELATPGKVFAQLMELHIRLAQCGLVHCDFNEFNVMINDKEELTVIDFPQMVSTSHKNAAYYFNRDVECLRLFFERRYGFQASSVPTLADCTTRIMELDKLAAASGFTKEDASALDEAMETYRQNIGKPEDDHVPHARTFFKTKGDGENDFKMNGDGTTSQFFLKKELEEEGEEEEDDDDDDDEEDEEDEDGEDEADVEAATAHGAENEADDAAETQRNIDKAGEKFVVLRVADDDDEAGTGNDARAISNGTVGQFANAQGGEDSDGNSEDEGGDAVASMNVPVPHQYDRDDDIRRAWRFSARPSGSGRGGATGAPAGGRGRGGGKAQKTAENDGNWKKAARNKVKDRERAKLNAVIKEST